jgi:U5 small nuclear ribonucleoprotein component
VQPNEIKSTPHLNKIDPRREYKYTDNRRDEIARQMSLKTSCLSLLLKDSRDKHYFFNLADTPGHPGFSDEVTAGMRLSDGLLLVVDVIEGVGVYVERLIKEAVRNGLPIIVVINKIDRLVLELKMPPADAYYKIKHTIDELNSVLRDVKIAFGSLDDLKTGTQDYFSPLNDNVCFASTLFGSCFTTMSFAKTYLDSIKKKSADSVSHSQQVRSAKTSVDIIQLGEDICFKEEMTA